MNTERSSDSEARLAVIDALLEETLGRDGRDQEPRELPRIVLARLAAGGGAAAAARVRQASEHASDAPGGVPPWFRRQWLAAAIALLGLGVVFGVAGRRETRIRAPCRIPFPRRPRRCSCGI